MSNPRATPPANPVLFKEGEDSRRNPGGRTPTKWLRELLNAASDKSPTGVTRRREVFDRLMHIMGADTVTKEGINYHDSLEAIKLIMAYDMGKPVESVEMSGADGAPLGGVMLVPVAGSIADWEAAAEAAQKALKEDVRK